jgi:putative N6-adenine-specific DNA methylase
LEQLAADELRALDAQAVTVEPGGVSFTGALPVAYAANLHSRLASRVLWQAGTAPYASEDDVYDAAHAVRWESHFSPQQSLRVDVTATRSPLRSLEFATLRIKDAIVDRLRERTGSRPSINRATPDVRVFAHLDEQTITLYLDLSGEPLFKRGWRAEKGEAPLKENLAAGLLHLAGWTPEQPLLDPFCGSGTILIEAASIAAHRAPGGDRPFGFERLQSFDRAAWDNLKRAARERQNNVAGVTIVGSDISTRVIDVARRNAQLAGFSEWLADGRMRLQAHDARSVAPPADHGLLITNPPYGEQSHPKSASVPHLMEDVSANLKHHYAGWTAWLLTSDRDLPRQMRLHETRKTVLSNGPIECRFFRFGIVAGSYRGRASLG